MATRLYFGTNAPSVSPAFDASWDSTGSAVRRVLETTKEAASAFESLAVATALNSPAGAVDVLVAQYVGPQLTGSGTVAAAIKGQVRALESSANGDLRAQCVIRLVSADGLTVRGTLVASDAGALASEFSSANLTNRKFPKTSPATPTSVAWVAGDRLVVEVGYRKHESATTSRTGTLDLGNPSGVDLAENETTTTQNVPWVEFGDTLAFTNAAVRVTSDVVEVGVLPTDAAVRATDDVIEVAVVPTDAVARVTDQVVEVGVRPKSSVVRVTDHVVEVAIRNPVDPTGQVHGDLSPDYVTRRLGTASLALDYEVLAVTSAEAHADLGLDYSVAAAATVVGSSLTFSARVTKAKKLQQRGVELTVTSPVQIRVIAGRNMDFGWVVEPPTSDIGADLQIDAEVQANTVAGADYQITAEVDNPTPRGDLGIEWVVDLATPSAELALDFALSGLAHGDLVEDAAVASLRHGDLTFAYEVVQTPGLASSDLAIDAVVRAFVSQDLALDYAVTTSVLADLSIDYVLRAPASGDLAVDATVRAPVDGDLALDYAVSALADGDLSLDAAVRSLVSTDRTVDSVTRSLAGSSLGLDHVVRATSGSDLSFEWLVVEQGAVGGEYRLDAAVRAPVSRDLAPDFAVAELVGSELDLDASTSVTAGGDLAVDYAVRETAGANLEIDVPEAVVLSGGYGDVFLEPPRRRRPPQDAPRTQVGKDYYFSSMVVANAGSNLYLGGPLAERVGSSLGLAWRLADAELAPAEARDRRDPNEITLLAEIDPDLVWLQGGAI